jgi:hypothetical protein
VSAILADVLPELEFPGVLSGSFKINYSTMSSMLSKFCLVMLETIKSR